ncbi:hypothetical protein MD484_g4346, partial [Candolleomyces efflorescens]
MPAVRNQSSSKGASANKSVQCPTCFKRVSRQADLKRHMELHDPATKSRFQCVFPGCKFKARQRSNYNTHLTTHTREKRYQCPDCHVSVNDPASLTRHRIKRHDYVPASRTFADIY